jgi:hypothetical protein
MKFAHFVLGGAIALAAVPLGVLPAYADGPPSPPVQPGCTFDGSTGQSTCVTTTQPTPVSATITPGESLPFPGGVTIALLCDSIENTTLNYNLLGVSTDGSITYDATSTTTTTTVHQGVSPHGHQVSQSTTTTAIAVDVTDTTGTIDCEVFGHHI